jgi:hypothetical protein
MDPGRESLIRLLWCPVNSCQLLDVNTNLPFYYTSIRLQNRSGSSTFAVFAVHPLIGAGGLPVLAYLDCSIDIDPLHHKFGSTIRLLSHCYEM